MLVCQLIAVYTITIMYYFTTVTLTSSADGVCPEDTVVFTCVTDTAPLHGVLMEQLRHTALLVKSMKLLECLASFLFNL